MIAFDPRLMRVLIIIFVTGDKHTSYLKDKGTDKRNVRINHVYIISVVNCIFRICATFLIR
jgi:hypothetical protein